MHVLPKLEYQLCYGAESLTHTEACQLWAEKLLHSSTVSFISKRLDWICCLLLLFLFVFVFYFSSHEKSWLLSWTCHESAIDSVSCLHLQIKLKHFNLICFKRCSANICRLLILSYWFIFFIICFIKQDKIFKFIVFYFLLESTLLQWLKWFLWLKKPYFLKPFKWKSHDWKY